MLTFARPNSPTVATLYHAGTLRGNLVPAAQPIADLQDTVLVPVPVPTSEAPTQYVPPDAALVTAAGYDDLCVDLQPTVSYALTASAASGPTLEAIRQVAATDLPYWILVRTDGYGKAASASQAVAAALAVAQWGHDTANSFMAISRLRGFAFLSPDLNVRFADGSVITRLQQNQLVQQCWYLGCAACVLTSRPADQTCLVAPQFGTDAAHLNPNSGQALQYPILGTNPAQRDRLVALYPTVQGTDLAPQVILGMMAGTIGSRGRDPGFPLNLDVGFALQLDESLLSSDGVGGAIASLAGAQRAVGFAAALGIRFLGVTGAQYVVPCEGFLPPDAQVNATGACRVGVQNGIATVAYSDGAGGEVVRTFDSTLQETSPAS